MTSGGLLITCKKNIHSNWDEKLHLANSKRSAVKDMNVCEYKSPMSHLKMEVWLMFASDLLKQNVPNGGHPWEAHPANYIIAVV